MKRYDLMHQVNTRGTFLASKACIPHLKHAANPHVLMLSPPLDMSRALVRGHVAYTMAKFGMSMCVLGMAEEFKDDGIAFNALWPRTGIATAAIEFALGGEERMRHCRTPKIMADAAYAIFTQAVARMHRQLLHRRQPALRGRRARFRQVPRRSDDGPDADFFVPDRCRPPGSRSPTCSGNVQQTLIRRRAGTCVSS